VVVAEERMEALEERTRALEARVAELEGRRPVAARPSLPVREWVAPRPSIPAPKLRERVAARRDPLEGLEDLLGGRVLAWVGGLAVLVGSCSCSPSPSRAAGSARRRAR
jgi:hypothetical protein